MVLERQLFDLKGKEVKGRDFKVGDLLLVHLTIKSDRNLPDALFVDLLPAGFEIENPNLKHSLKLDDSDLEQVKINGQPVWRLKERTQFLHEEFRSDRYVAAISVYPKTTYHLFYMVRVVTPGRFQVPPPLAESMYRPEIRGVGQTPGTIRVINTD